jgi:3-deoxy-D-manno-octulosonic acid kinase
MIKGGQRIATATGVMLADLHRLGNVPAAADAMFDPQYWSARGELSAVAGGRGSAWFVGGSGVAWVLRHYRRGGWVARISSDRYVWQGEDRVRAFAEWRLLQYLSERGLSVPKPVAARYQRTGLTYRCDLITERIVDSRSLGAALALAPVAENTWRTVGATIARLHRHGVDHADLNAHNILLDGDQRVALIDFDRGRLRRPGAWTFGNLRRLRRSLEKISRNLPAGRFTPVAWELVSGGYRAEWLCA